ncbi:MAG: ABC transporter ATP-binding protein [Treponema sp.]|nr:ABC transporter ATP-binding protein [Treponema sp.]
MKKQEPLLCIKKLNICAGQLPLINDFNLELHAGECRVISAPTGTGKTTLFNYIAGLLPQSNFEVTGEIIKSPGLKIAYVFQEPRLISSISALKNVMLPLENIMDSQRAQSSAREWLERFKLSGKIHELPVNLSGGEQQRVNLARAFAYSPNLLLLDEPFSSQDEQNAKNIYSLLKEMLFIPNTAALVITHNLAFFDDNSIIH